MNHQKEIESLLEHIREQTEKQQYLNALKWSQDLAAILLVRLNDKLKGRP